MLTVLHMHLAFCTFTGYPGPNRLRAPAQKQRLMHRGGVKLPKIVKTCQEKFRVQAQTQQGLHRGDQQVPKCMNALQGNAQAQT